MANGLCGAPIVRQDEIGVVFRQFTVRLFDNHADAEGHHADGARGKDGLFRGVVGSEHSRAVGEARLLVRLHHRVSRVNNGDDVLPDARPQLVR